MTAVLCSLGIASLLNSSTIRVPGADGPTAQLSPRPLIASPSPASPSLASANPAKSWSAIPLSARSAISTALAKDDPSYRLHGLTMHNPSQRLSVRFSAAGATVSTTGLAATLRFAGIGRASTPTLATHTEVSPTQIAQRVFFRHPDLTESWSNGPLGPEQSFTVAARPAGTGTLALAIKLAGRGIRASQSGPSILIANPHSALHYGGLVVTDATGRTLHSWLTSTGSRIIIHINDNGARYPLKVDPYIQRNEPTSSDGAAYDGFGDSVAISGDTIVVGAEGRTVNGNADQGAAYVFTEPASGWAHATQVAELTSSDGATNDYFGDSVAISGDTIVVGAEYRAINGHSYQGAAYVYTKPASGWAHATQVAELTSSDGAAEDHYGNSVAISGNTIAVGAEYHAVNGHINQGAAYVYTKPAPGWTNATQTAELTSSDGAGNDIFGYSVAISGNTIAVGAFDHAVNGHLYQGAAYVFTEPVSGWAHATQVAELTGSDGAAYDHFGNSVAISGHTIVIGAQDHAVNGHSYQGTAYVYAMPASGWAHATQVAELTSSDGAASDFLGYSVAISGHTIVIGAQDHAVNGHLYQGAAYVYTEPASGWTNATQTAELTSSDGGVNDRFGDSVAISGNTTIIGAYLHKVGSNVSQGTAYLFTSPAATSIGGKLTGGTKHGARITVKPKANVRFFATLTGIDASTATGTITYNIYKNRTCTRLFKHWRAQQISTVGTLPPSPPIKIIKPGTYYWQANYSGDQTNTGSKTRCGSFTETVTRAVH